MSDLDDQTTLNDLRIVLTVLREGSVSGAARRLRLTQSGLSYQLARMRRRFADDLFVRSGNRMAPTPFARRLADPAERVLKIVDSEIAASECFDPAHSERELRIGVSEIGAITFMPRLVKRMAALAPQVRVCPIPLDVTRMASALEAGEMDLAVGHVTRPPVGLKRQLLYRRDYVCIARRDHPKISEAMTLREFGRLPQVQSPSIAAARTGLIGSTQRGHVPMTVPMSAQQLAAIPFIVAGSDHVSMVPREIFQLFSPIAAIREVRLTSALPVLDIHQYWHPCFHQDAALSYFREVVFDTAKDESVQTERCLPDT